MWAISALGDIDGGLGWLTFWPAAVVVAIWSLVVIAFALKSALPAVETAKMMAQME